jgi:hypothetical protein
MLSSSVITQLLLGDCYIITVREHTLYLTVDRDGDVKTLERALSCEEYD